jgi:signal transduction histidine kinase
MPWVNDTFFPRNFDPQGHSLMGKDHRAIWDQKGFEQALKGDESFSQITIDDTPAEVRSIPLRHHGQIIGVGQVAYPLTEVNRALSGLDNALLTMIPIGLLCAGVGGAFLTDRVLRRVRNTTQAAARISVTGAGDLSERLPIVGNDEFSELADTFNGLLGRLETAFHQQARILEQQRRFTADASHELKTPLTVIKGTASMALNGDGSEVVYRRSLQEIDRAANSMAHLVQDLLLLARSDGGQLGKNRIELLAAEVLQQARTGVAAKGASIRIELEPESLTVAGNEMELIRLFTNLLDNAVRYTPASGAVTIAACAAEDNRTFIQVADTGPGMAPEHLSHLGERFYRVDSSRARLDGGTGLGLSICKSIVEANQGQMTIDSTPGQGTTVSVLLPRSL